MKVIRIHKILLILLLVFSCGRDGSEVGNSPEPADSPGINDSPEGSTEAGRMHVLREWLLPIVKVCVFVPLAVDDTVHQFQFVVADPSHELHRKRISVTPVSGGILIRGEGLGDVYLSSSCRSKSTYGSRSVNVWGERYMVHYGKRSEHEIVKVEKFVANGFRWLFTLHNLDSPSND